MTDRRRPITSVEHERGGAQPAGSTTRIDPHATAAIAQIEVLDLTLPASALP